MDPSRVRKAACGWGAWVASTFLLAGGLGPDAASAGSHVPAAARFSQELARVVREEPEARVVVWVRFTDRAGREREPRALESGRPLVSARALERRRLRGSLTGLDASDLPVHEPYVRGLVARGARLRGTSRWLNAASVEIPARLVPEIARLPFVAALDRVPRARRLEPVGEPEAAPLFSPRRDDGASRFAAPRDAVAAAQAPGDTAYYGGAFRQVNLMQVPSLHALGLSGAGVLLCMLDSGFRTTHRVFSGLPIVATRDFIHGDANVDNEDGQDAADQNRHGTMTLSTVAGSDPGTFGSPAFGVSVALAKTEDVPTETPVEMDYWQFGAEWADSLGADIISSSLGYSEFDNPADSYTYADMDGRTTVVTLAAVAAARRGITVVTAAGNAGATVWHHIIAPGDADSVITSGAVDSFNVVTSFSSRGPAADGRIKPDVTAMGRSVLMVTPSNDSTYVRANGTSFSTPLTAGVVALLLEAHPAWGPFEVREALRETALNHATPDTVIGWGLVQGLAANSWIPSTTGLPAPGPTAGVLALAAGPNPLRAGEGTMVRYAAPGATRVTLDLLDVGGRRRARLADGPPASSAVHWTGRDEDGRVLVPGVYWLRLAAAGGGTRATRSLRVVVLP